MTNINMYYYTKVMEELFLDSTFADTKNSFRGMTTMQDFWRVSHNTQSFSWKACVYDVRSADRCYSLLVMRCSLYSKSLVC